MAGRTVQAVLVKRTNPRWLDWYGHWWVELGEESYGWWPERRPVSLVAALRGVSGRLNGLGGIPGGSSSRDPRHGEPADHAFHPEVDLGRSDEEVAAAVRAFAAGHRGQWRLWWAGPGGNCRAFQHDLLAAAGLWEPPGYGHTHGGCPFLALARRVVAPVLKTTRGHQARTVSSRCRRPAGLLTGGGCRRWARHAVVLAETTGGA